VAVADRDPQLEAGRRRRLLAQLDKAIQQQRRSYRPPRQAAKPAASTQLRRLRASRSYEDARSSYAELRQAIQSEGGIRPNRDYGSSQIPRELRARRGRGKAPDEMAQTLETHSLYFEGDTDMMASIHARRGRLEETHLTARREAAHHGPSEVCTANCRNPHGAFARCENAAQRVYRYCARRWRDAVGRFRRRR
jgi:hypothetical protein